jgi:hypothetical protein
MLHSFKCFNFRLSQCCLGVLKAMSCTVSFLLLLATFSFHLFFPNIVTWCTDLWQLQHPRFPVFIEIFYLKYPLSRKSSLILFLSSQQNLFYSTVQVSYSWFPHNAGNLNFHCLRKWCDNTATVFTYIKTKEWRNIMNILDIPYHMHTLTTNKYVMCFTIYQSWPARHYFMLRMLSYIMHKCNL